MVRTRASRVVLLLTVCLGGVSAIRPAEADPIRITGGQIVLSPGLQAPGTIGLVGTGDFSVTGLLGSGRVDAKNCFPCEPGAPISLGAAFSGLDFSSTIAVFEGAAYPQVGGFNSPNQLWMELAGATAAPAFSGSTPVTLAAPFTMDGLFTFGPSLSEPTTTETMTGAGIASLTLVPVPGTGPSADLWQYSSVRFDFSSEQAAPIPEPASLLLVASGLVLVARRALTKSRA